MTKPPEIDRGDIWLVNFDPAAGAEVQKMRPAVVLNPSALGRLPLRIVVPITDWKSHYTPYPWFVHLPVSTENGLTKESGADSFQIKSVSQDRFVRRIGRIEADKLIAITEAAALCIGFEFR